MEEAGLMLLSRSEDVNQKQPGNAWEITVIIIWEFVQQEPIIHQLLACPISSPISSQLCVITKGNDRLFAASTGPPLSLHLPTIPYQVNLVTLFLTLYYTHVSPPKSLLICNYFTISFLH